MGFGRVEGVAAASAFATTSSLETIGAPSSALLSQGSGDD